MKRIAAFVPNILGTSPGQRIRIETWAQHLQDFGWAVDFYPFEDHSLNEVFYTSGHTLKKASRLASCYMRQMRSILDKPSCDLILIYREASLIGPAILERLARRLQVPIIYDIDDPLFLPYHSPTNGWFSLLKFSRKTHTLFSISDHIVSINRIIGDYAAKYNPYVTVVPNFLDTQYFCPLEKPKQEPRIGWIGSLSTMPNLASIAQPISQLQRETGVPVRIIGVGQANLPGVNVEVKQWSAATEVADLQECTVGLVPLNDLNWNPWKFFLKTVQYMAVGLPVVARRMGSNCEIIEDGVNGFLVETEREWYDRLRLLTTDAELHLRMSKEARKTAVEKFSIQAQMPRVAEIFDQVMQRSNSAKLPMQHEV